MNKILRKDAKIIDSYLKLAETNIYNNGLDRTEFEKGLQKFTSASKVVHNTTFKRCDRFA